MVLSSVLALSSYGKAEETYKKAVTVVATAAAYTMLARSMSRELFPDELRGAARWAAAFVRDRLLPAAKQQRTKTIFIGPGNYDNDRLYIAARAYLATRIDPPDASRLFLGVPGGDGARQLLSMVPGDSMTDVFEGVEFRWTLVPASRPRRRSRGGEDSDSDDDVRGACVSRPGSSPPELLALCFDAEQTDLALGKYVPAVMADMEEAQRRRRTLQIFMNERSISMKPSWRGITHRHPATFDTLAMDPELKRSLVADLDRFLKRKDYYLQMFPCD